MSRRSPPIRRRRAGSPRARAGPLRPGRIERPARKPKEIAMQRIKQSIEIKAPVANVFEHVNEPAKLHEIWPSLMEVANVQRKPNGSYAFDWVYKMVGMKLYGRSEPTEFAPDERIVVKSTGGVASTFRWTFSGANGSATKVDLEIEYEIPTPVLGRLAEAIVAKLNQREAESLLANLKITLESSARFEAHAPPPRH
jgi:uncharacterized membrane protein